MERPDIEAINLAAQRLTQARHGERPPYATYLLVTEDQWHALCRYIAYLEARDAEPTPLHPSMVVPDPDHPGSCLFVPNPDYVPGGA